MRVISANEIFSVTGGATVNGCTGAPDAPFGYNFKPACDNHDLGYSADSGMSKQAADNRFLNDMLDICKTQYNNDHLCRATAYTYYAAVSLVGGFFYEGASNGAYS